MAVGACRVSGKRKEGIGNKRKHSKINKPPRVGFEKAGGH